MDRLLELVAREGGAWHAHAVKNAANARQLVAQQEIPSGGEQRAPAVPAALSATAW